MYLDKSNNFFHGIMFHHFHDGKQHVKSQGSITKEDLVKIIKFIGRKNILDAEIFREKLLNNNLKENQVCFTFDDGIKSQIDIALPILEEYKIKSYFFVFTNIFEGVRNNLELFRYFRNNLFENINEFYDLFFREFEKNCSKNLNELLEKYKNDLDNIKKISPFYSEKDIKFRLIRDKYFKDLEYVEFMQHLFKLKNFDIDDPKIIKKLNFDKSDLITLNSLGHSIGLHAHSHPMLLENLSYDQQREEYQNCIISISKIIQKSENSIKSMSHPCGSYNSDTLKILENLNIDLGFKNTMLKEKKRGNGKINNSKFEIARQDHTNILKKINL